MSRTPNNTSPLVNNIQGKAYFLNQKLLLKYFLQDTADVYYGFLEINSTVNFVSEKWQHYFGFLPSPEQDILKERAKFLLDNSPKEYALLFKSLKTNEQVTFTYNYRNTIDKTIFRFSECVTKLYDEQLDEYIIAGRISEIKNNFSDSHFEQRVNEEKEKLNRLVNETKDIVLVTNTKGKIELMSSTVKEAMGFAEKDMLDKNISHFVSKDSLKKLNEQFQLAKNSQLKQFQELNLLNNKGELFPVDASFSFVTYSGDKNNKIFFHGKNSNIKTKPSDYSIPNENKYSNLLENLDLGVMEVDMNDTILWANKRFEKISGYTSQEIKDKKAIDLFISSAAEKNKMNIQILKRAENKHTVYEIKIKRKDGEMIDLIISGSPITDKEGKVIGSLGIHWDVTQIRKKEREIEWEKISRERETLNITISAEEKQREIISQELHDGVGQTLAFTNLFIQKAMNSDKISPDLCMKVQEKLNEALNEVRRISRNLKPYGLNELGLEDAIFELLNQYRLHKKTVFLLKSKSSDFKEIGFEVQRSIYLIVQELVKNAIAYANATAVSFQFKRTESKLVLTYQDNGNGFNPKKATTGLGLKKVNSRVDLYEGKINIDSFPKKGTDIRIEFPLNKITEQ